MSASALWVDPAWVHAAARRLETSLGGPFLPLDNGALLTVTDEGIRTSTDDGRSWSAPRALGAFTPPGTPCPGLLAKSRTGTLVLIYHDKDTYRRVWDEREKRYSDDSRQDIWSIRSTDGGRTWTDRCRFFSGYGAVFINAVATRGGRLVVPLQGLLCDRTHHATCTFVSADDGRSWRRSSIIDLGGHGNHDGAFEAAVLELTDGRLYLLIRTNLDRFWEAFSEDGGLSWRTIRPSALDASSAPAHLLRLASGRIALAWNRLYPERLTNTEKASYPRTGGDCQLTSVLTSWHREELSLAFSEDDARSWSAPTVIARAPGKALAYPYIFERSPGVLWITTRHPLEPRVRIALHEEDLAKGVSR